jgi:short-subunit dehydrogenase
MGYRTAFVTGASSGLGRALAAALAREGVFVGVAARREDELRDLAMGIIDRGGRARSYPLDVSDVDATTATLKRADEEMEGIDLVIANAGVSNHCWGGKLTYAECADIIAINVRGAVATLTALLPTMVVRGRGHLVGVSSLAQYRGLPSAAAYSASKAFLSTFLEGLRVDLQGTNVDITDLRPGFVRTPLTAKSKLPMPFLLDLDHAVDKMMSGIQQKAAVVAFPWQLATLVRAGAVLPTAAYDRAVRRIRGGQR